MSTTDTRTALPTGVWQLDPVHSTIGFELSYLGSTFRGQFREVDGTLDGDEETLVGAARVASVDVKDENLAAHLQSPEFFDAERHPELTFVSSDVVRDGEELRVRGDLAIKGATRPVELAGTITEPLTDAFGKTRVGAVLSTTIDRTEFGIEWNMPLPGGEQALPNEVRLTAELFFVQA
ncbi:MAG TPA: YceI family protein [Gaiellaceae bacterium]|nr:YceI family protein [Gaiellaceae bacterium]